MKLNVLIVTTLFVTSILCGMPIKDMLPVPANGILVPADIAEAVDALDHDNNFKMLNNYAQQVKGKEADQFLLMLEKTANDLELLKTKSFGIDNGILSISLLPAMTFLIEALVHDLKDSMMLAKGIDTVSLLHSGAITNSSLTTAVVRKRGAALGIIAFVALCIAYRITVAPALTSILYNLRNGDLQLARIKQLRDIVAEPRLS